MSSSMSDPAQRAVAVSKSDSVSFQQSRGLYVGTTGDIACVLAPGTDPVTFPSVAGGVEHALAVSKILSTGTTASGFVLLY